MRQKGLARLHPRHIETRIALWTWGLFTTLHDQPVATLDATRRIGHELQLETTLARVSVLLADGTTVRFWCVHIHDFLIDEENKKRLEKLSPLWQRWSCLY